MAYRNTFFRWLFLYSLTFGLTYVLKLFTYLCPETGHSQGLGVDKKLKYTSSVDSFLYWNSIRCSRFIPRPRL